MTDLESPFIIMRPNQCPICGAELCLLQTDVSVSQLDEFGHPGHTRGNIENRLVCSANNRHQFGVITDEYAMVFKPAYKLLYETQAIRYSSTDDDIFEEPSAFQS